MYRIMPLNHMSTLAHLFAWWFIFLTWIYLNWFWWVSLFYFFSQNHLNLVLVNNVPLFFNIRDGPYMPTLRLLHQCSSHSQLILVPWFLFSFYNWLVWSFWGLLSSCEWCRKPSVCCCITFKLCTKCTLLCSWPGLKLENSRATNFIKKLTD